MRKIVTFTAAVVAAAVALAAEIPDYRLYDSDGPSKIHPVPCRITFRAQGIGYKCRSFGLVSEIHDHWNNSSLAVLRTGYYPPKGKYTGTGSPVIKKDLAVDVDITHYTDHSELLIKEAKSGVVLVQLPYVVRLANVQASPNMLEFGKDAEKFIRDLKIDVSIPDRRAGGGKPEAPNGYDLVFWDRFCGITEKWGAPRNCTGTLTIPKKNYWCYAYPIGVPDIELGNGLIAWEMALEGGTVYSVRFRGTADDYYEFKCNRTRLTLEKKRTATAPEVIAKGNGFAKPGARTRFELKLDGDRITVSQDGRELLAAGDSEFARGRIFLCGSHSYEVRFFGFDVFEKRGDGAVRPGMLAQKPVMIGSAVDLAAALPEPDLSKCTDGVFVDAKGVRHPWGCDGKFLWYDGLAYIPLRDSDDQYFLLYEPGVLADERAWTRVRDEKTLADIRKFGLTWQIVPLRLADYVDPRSTEHGFFENFGIGGRSRLMEIAGDVFRVTDARRSLPSYFSYRTKVRRANRPHVAAYLVPDDQERYLGLFALPAESGSFGIATGRTFPCRGVNRFGYASYWPRESETEWIFMHNTYMTEISSKLDWNEKSGAAVGGFWMMEVMGEEADLAPIVREPEKGPVREIGDYFQRSGFIYGQFGVKADAKAEGAAAAAKRSQAFGAWLDHLRFAGLNTANVCWLGTDWILHGGMMNNVGYKTPRFRKYSHFAYDYTEELLPELDKRRFATFLSTATFNIENEFKADFGLGPEDLAIGPDGKPYHNFGNTRLDPASPKVKALYNSVVDELAAAGKNAKAVRGVALSIDGFFKFSGGYGTNALKRCERETGLKFPDFGAAAAYHFLTNSPANLATWRKWRGEVTKDLVLSLRDTVRKHHPDWLLLVRFLHEYSYRFRHADSLRQREIVESDGVIPEAFKDVDGVLFCIRSFYEAKEKALPGEYSFAYEHGVTDVPTREGTAHQQWTGYWETPGLFPLFSKYTYGWLGDPNTVPVGRTMLETATYHLANENTRIWYYQAWESAIAGTEQLMRRYATAFRALPFAEPKAFEGKASFSGALAEGDVKIARYGDRFAIINPTGKSGTVSLSLDADGLFEFGRGRTYAKSFFARRFEVEVLPYDLLVFKMK